MGLLMQVLRIAVLLIMGLVGVLAPSESFADDSRAIAFRPGFRHAGERPPPPPPPPPSTNRSGGPLAASADQLRALFVKRLVRYVSWPKGVYPGSGEPVIVATTAPRSLKPFFKPPQRPPFKLVPWPAEHLHVLVVSGVPEREAAAIIRRVADRPVLTIGQGPGSLRAGAIVTLSMRRGKPQLFINPEAAQRAGLTISSKLLRIAKIYQGDRP